MNDSYVINNNIREKFNKIKGDNIGSSVSRLEMVKLSVEKIIMSLLEKSPKVKVG